MKPKINKNGAQLACLAFLALFLVTCTQDSATESSLHTVSGTVYHWGLPLHAAEVYLDEAYNYTSYTNQNGYFEIHDVASGMHSLMVTKSFEDGSYTTRPSVVEVVSDVILNTMILPKAVTLHDIANATHESVELVWSPTDAFDFREYKIYRHTTSGLDEHTGTLVHVSTLINDTTFINTDPQPNQQYFYRVYVMNDFGALGGSNIVSTRTKPHSILTNGDFEVYDAETQLPIGWDYRHVYHAGGYTAPSVFSIDSLHAQSGRYCVKVDLSDEKIYAPVLYQYLDPTGLITGQRYKLSVWIKNLPSNPLMGGVAIYDDTNGFLYENSIWQSASPSPDWQEFSLDIYISKNVTRANLNMDFAGWQSPQILYLDNFSLIRVP